MTPKIGEPRIYDTEVIPVLYPGERATCTDLRAAEAVDMPNGQVMVTFIPQRWIVEPAPGRREAFKRFRYRLIGQWVERWRGLKPGAPR